MPAKIILRFFNVLSRKVLNGRPSQEAIDRRTEYGKREVLTSPLPSVTLAHRLQNRQVKRLPQSSVTVDAQEWVCLRV